RQHGWRATLCAGDSAQSRPDQQRLLGAGAEFRDGTAILTLTCCFALVKCERETPSTKREIDTSLSVTYISQGCAMIHVENLTKSFRDLRRGHVVAVDRVSFDARPGEIFGLLGPNGAGKTTTMRILCTVLHPTSGTARIAGFDVATQACQVRQHIGFLSANTAIYDRMSAWELVEYFGRLYGLERDRLRQRMEEVFTTLQMYDFRDVLGAKM